jgi:hypothetical protein
LAIWGFSIMRFLLVLIAAAFAATFLPKHASAIEGGNHYVRTKERIVIPWGGAVIPPGADISVRYDAGDSWITYSESVYPKLKKSSGDLEEEIIFDPSVEGVANKRTPTYSRFPLNVPLLYVGVVKPSASGVVIAKGESVKIAMREGDYYLVYTKKVNGGLVPVGSIDVSNTDLQSGQSLHVPPVPTAATVPPTATTATVPAPGTTAEPSHRAQRPGQLYGKLTIPCTVAGKELPAGGFVILAYEDGDSWILGGPTAHGQSISKDAVEPVARIDYFTRLAGRITAPTTVYKLMPDVVGVTKTLEQSEVFANLNPSIKVGDEVSITAREGDDFLIQFAPAGGMIKLGRVPVSAVEVTYGDPNSGTSVFVPPRPQNTDAHAPGYQPAPPQKTSYFWDYFVPFFVAFFAISILVGIAGFIYRQITNASTAKAGEADRGVPHAKYEKLEHGFKVTFVRSSETFYRATREATSMQSSGGLAGLLFFAMIIMFFIFVILWYGIESFLKTVIVVDRESITIGGKRMPREDFGPFNVEKTLSGKDGENAILGYGFGRRSFAFGGVWEHGEATQVASALNYHLRATPMVGDEHNPSPEDLQRDRPQKY